MEKDEVARDTIAAIATPIGRGGIGVVRLSGPKVREIAQALTGRLPKARNASLCLIRDARGERIDEGIVLYFPAPHSYTGEAVLELQGHGGPVVMQAVLAACLDAGARLAEPGEFTRRAFLEGKLDLAQAEAVADLIDAASRQAARSALRSLKGEFSAAIGALTAQLIELRALVEAMLDFPEEELDRLHVDDAAVRLARVRAALDEVLGKSRQGSLLRSGIQVVLAGRPNVGKSSLMNRLAGEERAIVTPIPGTTRDALREPLDIGGVPVILVDTAGLRASADEVERLRVARTKHQLARARERAQPTSGGCGRTATLGIFCGGAATRAERARQHYRGVHRRRPSRRDFRPLLYRQIATSSSSCARSLSFRSTGRKLRVC